MINLLLCIFFVISASSADSSKLEFSLIFFRHGERTTTNYLTFPTDPPGSDSKIPYEGGELTNVGIWQEYTLGSNLRIEYAKLVNYKYTPSKLRVLAGVDNRTIASALLALASFLPPTNDQIWNPALPWQPIPAVSDEIIDHVSFGIFDHCPSLTIKIKNNKVYEELNQKYSNLTNYLIKKTGLEISDVYILQKVIDAVINRNSINDFVPVPDWINAEQISKLNSIVYEIHKTFLNLFINLTGWHYDQILVAMDNFVNAQTNHKIIFYSGHDTNLITITEFFNINIEWTQMPEFASFLAFELHRDENDEHIVKVFVNNKLNTTKVEVFIKGCNEPCTYKSFAQLGLRRITSQEWMSVCLGTSNSDCPFYESITGLLVIFVVLLIACFLSTFWSCNSYKRKYQLLSNSETKSLL